MERILDNYTNEEILKAFDIVLAVIGNGRGVTRFIKMMRKSVYTGDDIYFEKAVHSFVLRCDKLNIDDDEYFHAWEVIASVFCE